MLDTQFDQIPLLHENMEYGMIAIYHIDIFLVMHLQYAYYHHDHDAYVFSPQICFPFVGDS